MTCPRHVLQELQALAADRGHPCDEAGIAIAKALFDVNGDGRLTAEVFASWWREGERRWDVFDMKGERRARVEGLVAFFTAFGPAGGALSGAPLVRMRASASRSNRRERDASVTRPPCPPQAPLPRGAGRDQQDAARLSAGRGPDWRRREPLALQAAQVVLARGGSRARALERTAALAPSHACGAAAARPDRLAGGFPAGEGERGAREAVDRAAGGARERRRGERGVRERFHHLDELGRVPSASRSRRRAAG